MAQVQVNTAKTISNPNERQNRRIRVGVFSLSAQKKLVLDKQASKIKLNMWLINEVQKSVWNKNLATTGT